MAFETRLTRRMIQDKARSTPLTCPAFAMKAPVVGRALELGGGQGKVGHAARVIQQASTRELRL